MFSSDRRGTNVISSNQSRELAVNLHILYCWKILNQVLLWEMCAFSIWDVFDGAFENVGQITPLFTGKPKRNFWASELQTFLSLLERKWLCYCRITYSENSVLHFLFATSNRMVLSYGPRPFFSSLLHSCQGCLRTTDGSRLDVS